MALYRYGCAVRDRQCYLWSGTQHERDDSWKGDCVSVSSSQATHKYSRTDMTFNSGLGVGSRVVNYMSLKPD